MLNQLKDRLKGKVVIVGIGNILRGDDGAGPELIKRCKMQGVRCKLMDVGEVPENYLEKIIEYNPDTILLVDAVDLGGSPGSIAIIGQDELEEKGLSTHNASIKLTMKYLRGETKAGLFLLGVQPRNLKLGNGLSKPVKHALNRIEECLIKCMNSA